MCVARTARRRRQQAANGFRHMAPMKRPIYKIRDSATAARKAREMNLRRQELLSRGVKIR